MWVWTCDGEKVMEDSYHTREAAEHDISLHETGSLALSIDPCPLTHVLEDNGEPCHIPNCVSYIPEES